jgi:hypothetical protein
MSRTTDLPNDRQRQVIAESGESLLKVFHMMYEQNSAGTETEFYRGQLSCWKKMLVALYSEGAAEEMIMAASKAAGLSMPHGGPLADDGKGYMGFDSYCHLGPIGPLQ